MIEKISEAKLPTKFGEFRICVYRNGEGIEHAVLVKGEISGKKGILTRLHSECLTGDLFHSLRCDCGNQLGKSLKLIAKEGTGIFIYLRQEGRGIGLGNKIKAYSLQEKGADTVEANKMLGFPADLRDYEAGAEILKDLKVGSIKLLTNNPKKIEGLEKYGIVIDERVPLEIDPNENNVKYLETKKNALGHFLSLNGKKEGN